MAAIPIISTDQGATALSRWQLLRTPAGVAIPTTAARLAHDFSDSSASGVLEGVDVSAYDMILVQAWGVASDGHDATLSLAGFMAGGPGCHFATVTATFSAGQSAASTGFHATEHAHPSIKNAFVASQAYNGCDLYVLTSDFSPNKTGGDTAGAITTPSIIIPSAFEADFPSAGFVVDLRLSRYTYLSVTASALTGATNVGLIFRALNLRGY